VLAGEEAFLAEEAIAAVVRRVLPDGDPGGALVALDASSPADRDRVASALEELLTPSLFGDGKVVVVRAAEALGTGPAEERDDEDAEDEEEPATPAARAPGRRASPITTLVKAACGAPAEGRVLVLATRKPVRGKSSVSADALARAGALVVDCRRLYDSVPPWARSASPFDTEVARWVARRARAVHGKAMDLRAAHALAQRAGAGLATLSAALETLSAYAGARPALTEADVAATVAVTREDPAWALADAVLERDAPRALALAGAAFERGLSDARGRVATRPEAVFPVLVAAVHGAWRRAMLAAEARARGDDPASVPALSGLPGFVVERVVAQAERRGPDDLLARHRAFVEAETGVRGGGVPPRLALERMVLALAG
jgi:DNA polymerase-3 subunit delta